MKRGFLVALAVSLSALFFTGCGSKCIPQDYEPYVRPQEPQDPMPGGHEYLLVDVYKSEKISQCLYCGKIKKERI